jgi:glycosyltransferase involved in cell wall biosynthesis
MPRNLLVLTYEFPPSGGGGVQRVAKFCRYLPGRGWVPHVVAAEPVEGRSLDPSLVADVARVDALRTPARHVATAIARVLAPVKAMGARAKRGTDRSTARTAPAEGADRAPAPGSALTSAAFSSRVARWIAVPDDAVFWKRGAVRAAVELGRREQVAAVFASGPPFSAIVAGARAARSLGVPLVADMRDGWATNPVVSFPTRLHDAYSHSVERRTLRQASIVTCTTPAIADEARAFGAADAVVIPNGFDPADLPPRAPDPLGQLRVVYMGKVYFGHSDPTLFLESLSRLAADGGPAAAIEFDLVGSWPAPIEEAVDRLGLSARVRLHAYLPHREALAIVARADVGLVLIADRPGAAGSAPAKMYEYMGMALPTLLVGPASGFPAHVVEQTAAGVRVSPGDPTALDTALRRMAQDKAEGRPIAAFDLAAVREYDRTAQAARLAEVLDAVVSR